MNRSQFFTLLMITMPIIVSASEEKNSSNNETNRNIFDNKYCIKDLVNHKLIEGSAKNIIVQQKQLLLGLVITSNQTIISIATNHTSLSSESTSKAIDTCTIGSQNYLNLIKTIQEIELNERKLNNSVSTLFQDDTSDSK